LHGFLFFFLLPSLQLIFFLTLEKEERMVSITALSILSTLFISHVLKLLQSKSRRNASFHLDAFVCDLILFCLVVILSFFASHSYTEAILMGLTVGISTLVSQTPSRIVAIVAIFTHFSDIFHELLFKFMGRNKEHDKNWERLQRNEVRETFLHFLQLKRKLISLATCP